MPSSGVGVEVGVAGAVRDGVGKGASGGVAVDDGVAGGDGVPGVVSAVPRVAVAVAVHVTPGCPCVALGVALAVGVDPGDGVPSGQGPLGVGRGGDGSARNGTPLDRSR